MFWATGEPSGGTSKNCVKLDNNQLFAVPCSDAYFFACDLPATPTNPPVGGSMPTDAPVFGSMPTNPPVFGPPPTDTPAVVTTPTKNPAIASIPSNTPSKAPATKTPTKTPTKAPSKSPTTTPTTKTPTKAPTKAPITTTVIYENTGIKRTWQGAEAFCMSKYGTHLATVRSAADQAYLDSINKDIWIGLNDRTVESFNNITRFVWASGYPYNASESYWKPNEPNGGEGEDCIGNEGGARHQWTDFPCSYTLETACDKPATASPTASPTYRVTIQAYTDLGRKTWGDAEKYCVETKKTHLATVKNPADQAYLDSLKEDIWIGLNDKYAESKNDKTKFKWANKNYTDVTTFTYWKPNEPNGGEDENCITNEAGKGFQWTDVSCNEGRYFACDLSEESSSATTAGVSILSAIAMIFAMVFVF